MTSLELILPSKLFEILESNGIYSSKQVTLLSFWDLKKITKLKSEDIKMVQYIVSEHTQPMCMTCDKLMLQERNNDHVSTGCDAIDNILKGGFRRGNITEIYGESSSGKTQIAIQATVNNWENGCIYICTEDLFPVKRYDQVKSNIPNYCSNTDYGKNTLIEHITESDELLSCLRVRLPKVLSNNKIALVVIDSIAAPFRVDTTNYIQRAEDLREVAYSLINLAKEQNFAVVCINQVSAAFNECSDDVIPSLGLAWANMISTRLRINKSRAMECDSHIRTLSVEFSSHLPYSTAKFVITSNGIRGIS